MPIEGLAVCGINRVAKGCYSYNRSTGIRLSICTRLVPPPSIELGSHPYQRCILTNLNYSGMFTTEPTIFQVMIQFVLLNVLDRRVLGYLYTALGCPYQLA